MKNINWNVINFGLILLLIGLSGFGLYFLSGKLKNQELITKEKTTKLLTEKGYGGQVEYIEGEVEKQTGSFGWKSINKGDFVEDGDGIRTLNDSRAIVTFEDGSILRLDENTETKINSSSKDKIEVALSKGTVFNRVSKSDTRKYSVKSGEFKIVALGTEFSVEKETNASAKVMVLESEVEVQNNDGKVLHKVESGKKVEIKKDKKIEKKTILEVDKKKDFLAWNIKKNKERKDEEKKKEGEKKGGNTLKDLPYYGLDPDHRTGSNDDNKKTIEKDEAGKIEKKEVVTPKISFWAQKTNDGVKLTWALKNVESPKGFKIVKSTGKNPVYPGDDYKYISDSSQRSYQWDIKDGKGYYFRVCQYLGGKCGLYSRNVYIKTSASSDENDDNNGEVTSIVLSGQAGSDYADLSWKVDGVSSKGFKLVRSTSKNPVYPGDDYKYFSDKNKKNYKWQGGYEKGQKYYFRVCQYLGGRCGVYSNNVSFTFSGDNNDDNEGADLSLSVSKDGEQIKLTWSATGDTSHGFKAVYSKDKNPVYPGNTYRYLSSPETKVTEWPISEFEEGQTYHFRVCAYQGGGVCGDYSNDVTYQF